MAPWSAALHYFVERWERSWQRQTHTSHIHDSNAALVLHNLSPFPLLVHLPCPCPCPHPCSHPLPYVHINCASPCQSLCWIPCPAPMPGSHARARARAHICFPVPMPVPLPVHHGSQPSHGWERRSHERRLLPLPSPAAQSTPRPGSHCGVIGGSGGSFGGSGAAGGTGEVGGFGGGGGRPRP